VKEFFHCPVGDPVLKEIQISIAKSDGDFYSRQIILLVCQRKQVIGG
jgi:hypothetical protein